VKPLTRREFLQRSAAGAGLVVCASLLDGGPRLFGADEPLPEGFHPNVWLEISPDELVTIEVSKVEMGQGISTALPLILADELGANWERVRFHFAPAADAFKDPVSGYQSTGSSASVVRLHELLRAAGAAAREMLVQAAAAEWGVPSAECAARQGEVDHAKSGRKASYGRLCGPASRLAVPTKPALKPPSERNLVGRPHDRLDMAAKVNGTAAFGIDTFVDGMLYATVARPSALWAKPLSYDSASALALPGVRHVAEIRTGIAVCADSISAAWDGRRALKVRWDAGEDPDWSDEKLDDVLRRSLEADGIVARNDGDAESALASAASRLESSYQLPYLYHATMEPMNCTADARRDECRIWAPAQNLTSIWRLAASLCDLPLDKVHVQATFLGGGYGRRGIVDFAEEAVRISLSARRPVKLLWTREDDIRRDFFRPAALCRIAGGLDRKGRLVAWRHKTAVPSVFERLYPNLMKDGIDPFAVNGLVDMPYDIPHLKVEWMRVDSPVSIGPWRSVGYSINTFTVESFVDELAHAAGIDTLEFRVRLLSKQGRSLRLLEILRDKSSWGKKLPAGWGRGMAFAACFGSLVAMAAEVAVDRATGKVKVRRIVCAADCGSLIEPKTAAFQIEGGAMMGLSATLKEAVSFARGGVASENFDDYELLRQSDAPEIEVHLVPSGDELGGIGELGVPTVAPAVANAVFAASGVRVKRLPLTPEAFLAAAGP
jgi:isoquinoline 1-oxidoreductase subunit beta